jgi:V-type H+-transporting ATPase subunit H
MKFQEISNIDFSITHQGNCDPFVFFSARPKTQDDLLSNGEASNSKSKITCVDDVLKGLVEWFCAQVGMLVLENNLLGFNLEDTHCHTSLLMYNVIQLKKPSNPSRSIPTAISCLATLLKEPVVRSLFVQGDGVKLLIPLICPASTQQSIQVTLILLCNPSTLALS